MKKSILILLSSFLLSSVTNDATITIGNDVNVVINTDLINTGNINNNGNIQINGFYFGDNGVLTNAGVFESYISGDVNSDNNVNIYDIVLIVSFIMGSYSDDNLEFLSASDVNLDGSVNVSDIVLVVNLILSLPL